MLGGQIADQTGSTTSGSAGAGGVVVKGSGTVDIAATNSFTGGLTLDSGAATLQIDSGVAVNSTITGWVPGDVFDFKGIDFATATAAFLTADTLTVSDGTHTQTLIFHPGTSFNHASFAAVSDGKRRHCGGLLSARHLHRRAARPGAGGIPAHRRRGLHRRWQNKTNPLDRPPLLPGLLRRRPPRHPPHPHPPRVRWPTACRSATLLVSPEHALLLDGILVPARHLTNGVTILPDDSAAPVDYFHIELAEHDIILAEGVPAETLRRLRQPRHVR